MQLWEESLAYVKESEIRARINGASKLMFTFDFIFGAMLGGFCGPRRETQEGLYYLEVHIYQ